MLVKSRSVIINPYIPQNHLAELMQALEIRMAFARKETNGSYTQLHDSVKCRDFLGDVLHAEQSKQKINIYGFTYDGTTNKIDRDKTRLLLFFPNTESANSFVKNSSIVHNIEKTNKLLRTKLYKTKDPLVYVLESSPFWLRSVVGISLYTYLLKCMGYDYNKIENWFEEVQQKTYKDQWDNVNPVPEALYAKSTQQYFKKLTTLIKPLTRNLKTVHGTKSDKIHNIHNYSGFVSVCTSYNPYNTLAEKLQQLITKEENAV